MVTKIFIVFLALLAAVAVYLAVTPIGPKLPTIEPKAGKDKVGSAQAEPAKPRHV